MRSTDATISDPEVTYAPGLGAFAPLPVGEVSTQHGPVQAMFLKGVKGGGP